MYLSIVEGDITADEILSMGDAIVLPTNPMMRPGAGVSGAIYKKAGVDVLENYTSQTYGISYFNPPGINEMKVTEVRITPGFGLGKDIIFAQGPKRWDYDNAESAIANLLLTYRNIVFSAKQQGYKSVLTPSLGTGEYGFVHEEIAKAVVQHLFRYAQESDVRIVLVLYTKEFQMLYQQAFLSELRSSLS